MRILIVSKSGPLVSDRGTLRAIRTGRHMGASRPIMPPMPWPAFRNATDDDLKAIYTYLRTITPMTNHVPDYQPPAGGAASASN
jgi:hypothetical protein